MQFSKKRFLADTNFILHWYSPSDNLPSKLYLRLKENNCKFFQNVIVYQELMHCLLMNFLGDLVYESLKENHLLCMIGSKEKEKNRVTITEKHIKSMRKENHRFLKEASQLLNDELYEIEESFPYLSTFNSENRPNWEDTKKLIFEDYLCPSDTMIANFVLSIDSVDGLVTCDNDFKYCKEFEQSKDKFLLIIKI